MREERRVDSALGVAAVAAHGDVLGRQQEHLAGDPLDLAVEARERPLAKSIRRRASASLICERLMMTGMPSRKFSAITWASRYCSRVHGEDLVHRRRRSAACDGAGGAAASPARGGSLPSTALGALRAGGGLRRGLLVVESSSARPRYTMVLRSGFAIVLLLW